MGFFSGVFGKLKMHKIFLKFPPDSFSYLVHLSVPGKGKKARVGMNPKWQRQNCVLNETRFV